MSKELNVEFLIRDAQSIANVLATHKVFGVVKDGASPAEKDEMARTIAREKEQFVRAVLRHAADPRAFQPETLQYHNTGAWVRFNTKISASGRVLFSIVDVIPAFPPEPHLESDPNIDYVALAHSIHFIHERNTQD